MSTFLGAEQDMVDVWCEALLKAHAPFNVIATGLTDRIYNWKAPTGAEYPFIIYQAQSPPRDVRGVGSARVMVDTIYVVKAVAQAQNFNTLRSVAREIDVVMTKPQGGVVVDGLVLSSIRDEQFSLVEEDDGKQYRHLGGVFHIQAQAAP